MKRKTNFITEVQQIDVLKVVLNCKNLGQKLKALFGSLEGRGRKGSGGREI